MDAKGSSSQNISDTSEKQVDHGETVDQLKNIWLRTTVPCSVVPVLNFQAESSFG